MRFRIFDPPAALPRARDDDEQAAARRRTLYDEDLATDVDAKRAEHRILGELVTPRARSAVARFIRRLRRAR